MTQYSTLAVTSGAPSLSAGSWGCSSRAPPRFRLGQIFQLFQGESITRFHDLVHALEVHHPPLLYGQLQVEIGQTRVPQRLPGIDAVKEIFANMNSEVPVIYITAYPEMLLQGQDNEPSYLIPKPFEPLHVRTVVDQAILSAFLGQETA